MAKTKSKKGLADKVRSKQKNKTKQPPNPFEVKVNKVKHSVVNKHLQKWEKGIPGVSRSKAVKMRKDTLLKELHHMKKANSLLDKRFGENDSTLSADDKMVQRFALEKKKQMKKGDFSLNDEEEVLTHYGQSLVENLKDTIGSDSEEEEDGKLRMGQFQFGGFSKEGDEVSYKDKMKEVIADSKKQKYERQAEKEKTVETTKELDSSWKSLVSNFKPVNNNQTGKKVTAFMQLFHNLVMEQKSAGATDKLKTEEEKAKEEAERLKQLEAQRIARMKGKSKQTKRTHTSADDLNDGFALEKPKRSVTFAGQSESEDESGDRVNSQDQEALSDTGDNNKEAGGSGDEDSNDDDDNSDSDDDEEDEDGSDSDDSYSDLASENESENYEAVRAVEKTLKSKKELKPRPILKNTEGIERYSDFPFFFHWKSAPGSYSELKSLLHGHAADEQSTIILRLRKCHHPSLAEGNKEKLETIQQYLLQYFGDIVKQKPLDQVLVDHVVSHLWEMTQTCNMSSATAIQNLLLEHHKEYTAQAERRDGRGTFPGTDTLMYLRLVECLFPTSDFQHPVTTPAMHFITQMLSECVLRNSRDVVAGLFLCSLALKFVGLSRRYVPEVITFLHGLLYLAAEKNAVSGIKVFPPIRAGGKTVDLCIRQKCSQVSQEWSLSDLLNKEPTQLNGDQFRCEVINRCLDSLLMCLKLWEDLPCVDLIFEPCMKPLSLLPKHLYPADMQAKIEDLSQKMLDSKSKTLKVMQQPSKKPVPLKLFEPEIQEFWAGKRKKGGPNKDVNERQRLNHKYKKELKSAIREVKRDNEVLARHQLETVLQKKRKTKDLMNSLANQEGDFKAMKKIKK
ncbi:unnamed protein product [Candidula unifasciata]|uniref:Nucleolar protein 14 n=1 Tax=Candidula unifasciata TaxID=100452 RepID=A0A8S3Z316_9EUPU|nr:unnamed protein product [Candidula unifasciata]